MKIERWSPNPVCTPEETALLGRLVRTRKLFRFLREQRDVIFDDSFQDELAGMYRSTGAGKAPVAPALMAMATLLQGYVGASDAEAVELTVVDRRWQLVLGCLGASEPAFSQGALQAFRQRMIEHDMDRRVLQRTAEVARETGGFDPKKLPKSLRVAVDSAPLQGAGRVEDTINLLGHAARQVVECVAFLVERDTDELCAEAGIPLLLFSSVKRGLDRDWSDPLHKREALNALMKQVEALQAWVAQHLPASAKQPPLGERLATLQQVVDQDLEPDPDGDGMRVREGVAANRRISIEDGEMRHGRKSASKRVDGFKRHIAKDLEEGVILACPLTPANQPENEAVADLVEELESHGREISELHVDRGYISSPIVGVITERGGEVVCKPWRQSNRGMFTKEDFDIDLETLMITCPAGETITGRIGGTASFPASACDSCPLRSKCTTARLGTGRSIRIATDEALQRHLREMARSSQGRQRFRLRVPVEHSLAHVVQRQGHRARYFGVRSNLFDLRRAAAIQNLEVAQRKAA